jgi:hypothetical protein
MAGDSPYLLPAFLIARRLGVSKQLVYWWKTKGHLEPAGTGDDGRPLYDLRAASRIEATMRRSPQSHRAMVA